MSFLDAIAGSTTATALKTSTGAVQIGDSAPPNPGAVLVAVASDHAIWIDAGLGITLSDAAPSSVSVAAGSAGTGPQASRGDHQHLVATAAPVAVAVGLSAGAGSSSSLARADHVHPLPSGAPAALTVGGAAADGVATTVARSDHAHAMPGAATPSTPGFLSATDKTKLDTVATGAAGLATLAQNPTNIRADLTQNPGVGTTAARHDHQHSISVGTPTNLTPGGSNFAGTSFAMSLADHTHGLPPYGSAAATLTQGNDPRLSDDRVASGLRTTTGVVVVSAAAAPATGALLVAITPTSAAWQTLPLASSPPPQIAIAGAVGTAPELARADHTHAHGNQTDGALHAVASTTLAGFISAADKLKLDGVATGAAAPSDTVPVSDTAATGSAGVAADVARSDHRHQVTTAAPVALTVGGANASGSAASLARSDHTHQLPAFGSTSGTFAQGSDARLSDDRTASGLRTATTTVAIAASAAPSAGQALIATGTAAAAWATIASSTTPSSVGASNAVGAGTTYARGDHAHAHGAQTDGTMHAAATTSVAGFLSTADKTRLDGMATGAAALGSATPPVVDTVAGDAGVATTASRVDHRHQVSVGSPSALTVGAAAAAGSAATLIRSDHVHAMPGVVTTGADGFMSSGDKSKLDGVAASAAALTSTAPPSVGTANAAGVATVAARGDHAHAHGAQTDGTLHAAATTSVAGFLSTTDKSKLDGVAASAAALTSSAPVNVGTANAVGVGTTAARHDHAHAHGAQTDGTLHAAATTSVAGFLSTADKTRLDGMATGAAALTSSAAATVATTSTVGVATVAARGDHAHAHGAQTDGTMHAAATTSVAGFLSTVDKLKLDGLAASFKTAVRVGSTAHIANVDIGGNQPNAVDGISLAVGDRVLVKDQVAVTNTNGIYSVTVVGTGSNGTWVKATDADAAGELVSGSLVYIAEGSQAGQWWQLSTLGTITPGTTSQTWVRQTHSLTSSAPANVGTTAAVGVSVTGARSDHVHAHGAQTDGTLHAAVVAAGASGFMSGSDKTKLDGIATGAAAVLSVTPNAVDGSTGNGGAATTASRSDHRHQVTTGSPSSLSMGAANAAGTSNNLVRADHIHALPASGTPTALTLAGANAAGAAATLALSDHVHALPATAAPASLTVGGASSAGVASTIVRSDHAHAMPGLATSGAAGFMAAADKSALDTLTLLKVKDVCDAVAEVAITLSGTGSYAAGLRVLVTAQVDAKTNGIYVSAAGAWARAADLDSSADFGRAILVPVLEYSESDEPLTWWSINESTPITLGVTSLTFREEKSTEWVFYTLSNATAPVSIGGQTISVGTPAAPGDAATRQYVDNAGVVPWIIDPNGASSMLYADEFIEGTSPDLATRGYTCTNISTGATMTRQGPVSFAAVPALSATQYASSLIGSWLFLQTGAAMSVTKTMSAPFGCVAMRGVPSNPIANTSQRLGVLVANSATYSTSTKLMVGFVNGVSNALTLGASYQTGTGAITVGTGAAPTVGNYDADVFVASKGTVTAEWGVSVRKADPPVVLTEFWSLSPPLSNTATVFGFVVDAGNTGAGQRHCAIDYIRRYPANTFFGY